MEYIDGESLEQRLLLGPLPWATALPWAIQIASAIDAAHQRGIVHRDLKPANVMIAESGVKLLDFGLAKLIEGSDDEGVRANQPTASLTSEHRFVGTLRYMAPEQLDGRHVDAYGHLRVRRHAVRKCWAILRRPAPSITSSGRAMAKHPTNAGDRARSDAGAQWILMASPPTTAPSSRADSVAGDDAIGAVLALASAAAVGCTPHSPAGRQLLIRRLNGRSTPGRHDA